MGRAVSCAHLAEWATACGLPVAASFRRQDLVDNALACYVGDVGLGINPRLAQRIRDADLLIAVGPRLTEIETQGYTLPAPPVAPQTLVHVHPDPARAGPGVPAARWASSPACRRSPRRSTADARVDGARWADWARDARADYEALVDGARPRGLA